jgi:hypothetical protein
MFSERKDPPLRPLEEVVRGIQQIDAETLNQQIKALHQSQIVPPEMWNLQTTI